MIAIVGIDPSFTGFGMYDGETATVASTKPILGILEEASCNARVDQIMVALSLFLDPLLFVKEEVHLYVEAPILNSHMTANTSVYQLGFLYSQLHRYADRPNMRIFQMDRHSVMSALFGKKLIKKDETSGYAHRKFGVLFERDPGLNRLHAFLMYQYGLGVSEGRYELTVAKRRTKGVSPK